MQLALRGAAALTTIQRTPRVGNRVPLRSFLFKSSAAPDLPAEVDYVIVGAGSAGGVLAARLTEDPGVEVAVLEAGPWDRGAWDSWKIQMPGALTYNLADDKYNWCYHTTPQVHLNGRTLPWPRGRVIGGSSSLNAMVYIRGHAFDYDRWGAEGADGWSYAACLPYFRKAQCHELGADTYRGGAGPLHMQRGTDGNELFAAFVRAGVQAGYPATADLNGYQQEGFGAMDMTIYRGRRWSSSAAYLHPALAARPRQLRVRANTLVHRVAFDATGRADGVVYGDRHGAGAAPASPRTVRARREVILCGGAVNTPQLLLLSGVGDAAALRRFGIPVVAHSPGVGRNLQDHLDLYVQVACTRPITLYTATWRHPHRMLAYGAEWLLRGAGRAATAHLESGGFIRTAAGVRHPDLQFHFLPGALTGQLTPGTCHAYQVHCSPMRPTSVGAITLASRDPAAAPVIDPNYLATDRDRADYRTAVRLTLELLAQPAFDAYRGRALAPGPGVDVSCDAALDAWIRAHTESAYHPCGTARMGPAAAVATGGSVTDGAGAVHGVAGLRVVDASLMPSNVSGNLNAPVIMMAEKIADAVRGRAPLPLEQAPVYEAPNWRTAQR